MFIVLVVLQHCSDFAFSYIDLNSKSRATVPTQAVSKKNEGEIVCAYINSVVDSIQAITYMYINWYTLLVSDVQYQDFEFDTISIQ